MDSIGLGNLSRHMDIPNNTDAINKHNNPARSALLLYIH